MNIKKENNLESKIVYDLTPFTHLDYPDHLACIVWLIGCNMRCDYCYNKDIVLSKKGDISFNDILCFLDNRIGLLDSIVISGGEATSHNLVQFCKEVKNRGFKIKLDTNGINYIQIKELIDLKLIDFIALDYKATKEKFEQITHLSISYFDSFEQTLECLIKSNIEYEVRTTIHRDLLDESDINFMAEYLYNKGYKKDYYLQNFLQTDENIANIKSSSIKFNYSKLNNNVIIR